MHIQIAVPEATQSGAKTMQPQEVLQVSEGELGLMVNKIQQDFARGNMAKIPHMIYEHLKWVIKAPAAHARVLLEACVDIEGYKASGTGFPSATRRRSTDLKALPDTGCMATCIGTCQLSLLGIGKRDLLFPR